MKVILNGPFQSISGRVGNLVIHHRKNGTCYASRIPDHCEEAYTNIGYSINTQVYEEEQETLTYADLLTTGEYLWTKASDRYHIDAIFSLVGKLSYCR